MRWTILGSIFFSMEKSLASLCICIRAIDVSFLISKCPIFQEAVFCF
jgi:hypothetical protein